MNRLLFNDTATVYYTPQGLMRDKKRGEKRSRSKTVSDGRGTISKTTSRSSDDERTTSPSPTLGSTSSPSNTTEELPALPDSVPSTPATTSFEPEPSVTPKAHISAGSMARFLQPSVEDAQDPTDQQAVTVPAREGEETLPIDALGPNASTAAGIVTPEQPIPGEFKEDNIGLGVETTSAPESAATAIPTHPENSSQSVEKAVKSSSIGSTASKVVGPPPQHDHPAHGLSQNQVYHPHYPYMGINHNPDGSVMQMPYPHSPSLQPLVSYSPVPAFHHYPQLQSMSMIPAQHQPAQYYQNSMISHQMPGPPIRQGKAHNQSTSKSSDDEIIEQIATLLPEIIRLVNKHNNDKADMKAVRSQYEKIIETLTVERSSLRRDLEQARYGAQHVHATLLANSRLQSEKQALLQDVAALKDEKSELLESRNGLIPVVERLEKAKSEMKQLLEVEKAAHVRSLEAGKTNLDRQIIKAVEEATLKLRNENALLTNDRNKQIRELDGARTDHAGRTQQFEARIRELEDTLDKSRKTRKEEAVPSKHVERSSSISAASNRDMTSRPSTTSQTYDRTLSNPVRPSGSGPVQPPTRSTTASQYYQSNNSSNGRVITLDRLPGGYDYYDSVMETPRMERTMSSRNGTGQGDAGHTENRNQ